MNKLVGILSAIPLLAVGNAYCASDGFGGVRCEADIPKALIGQTISSESAVAIEERHKNLGLKNLEGSEVSDRLFLSSWQICGDEYQLLEEKDVVRDVLKFPHHSKDAPEFVGSCQMNSKDVPGTIIAVLKNEKGKEALAATAAWKIDEKGKKFVKLEPEGLRCPRDGVSTVDGGT